MSCKAPPGSETGERHAQTTLYARGREGARGAGHEALALAIRGGRGIQPARAEDRRGRSWNGDEVEGTTWQTT